MGSGVFLNGMTMRHRIRKKNATAAIGLQTDIRSSLEGTPLDKSGFHLRC